MQMGSDGGNKVIRRDRAKTVPQPGDGSCLFHSLCFGLGVRRGGAAEELRRELARFVLEHPNLEIAGDTLEEWVRWDQNTSCQQYAQRMARSGWGGGIEMAACSQYKKVNVHVYEQQQGGNFRRISCFDNPSAQKTVHVLYRGRMHFDALVIP
jgi:hypothetical protein